MFPMDHRSVVPDLAVSLGRVFRERRQRGGEGLCRRRRPDPVARRDPPWIVVRQPRDALRVLPANRFIGRSMPAVGAACISGVPAAGLPKITRSLYPSTRPACAAPLACGISANTLTPLSFSTASSRALVSAGSNALAP